MFYIGQKVICVNDDNTLCVKKGSIYIIEGFEGAYSGIPCLVLVGVADDGKLGRGMYAYRFRPLVDTKTDVFQEILKKIPRIKMKEHV